MKLLVEDAREALDTLALCGESFDSCVTDPPYYFESIVRRFGATDAAPAQYGRDGAFARQSRNFIGQRWDSADESGRRIAFDSEFWKLVYDVMKPGGFLWAFGGAHSGHRMACAIEDAGFRMHPMWGWAFPNGLPKGHPLAERVAKAGGDGEAWGGWRYGTQAVKPMLEPIYLAQRPIEKPTMAPNVIRHGVGALNIGAIEREVGQYPGNLAVADDPSVLSWFPAEGSRAFYCAKPNKEERAGLEHPTMKPVSLMRVLIRIVTPPGGRVLDPFAGSGTTAVAAALEGADCTLIENNEAYAAGIRRRIPELDDGYDLI